MVAPCARGLTPPTSGFRVWYALNGAWRHKDCWSERQAKQLACHQFKNVPTVVLGA